MDTWCLILLACLRAMSTSHSYPIYCLPSPVLNLRALLSNQSLDAKREQPKIQQQIIIFEKIARPIGIQYINHHLFLTSCVYKLHIKSYPRGSRVHGNLRWDEKHSLQCIRKLPPAKVTYITHSILCRGCPSYPM